ncbi:MAG: zf-HC2 domain-containing protein [Gemmatimonas sp.]
MLDLKPPLSCEQFETHVSEYIDSALPGSQRALLDAHASQCDDCRTLLADLRAIVGSAASLPPLSPSRELWTGIAARLDTPVVSIGATNTAPVKRGRTVSFRVFAAAAVLLVALSSGITYVVARANSNPVPAAPQVAAFPRPAAPASPVGESPAPGTNPSASIRGTETAPTIVNQSAAVAPNSGVGSSTMTRYASRVENSAEFAYEREITAMRRIVDERLGDLDSVTVVEIERNLRIIDQAISDSRRALENDPRSHFLSKQLDRALENKLDIMRRIALL